MRRSVSTERLREIADKVVDLIGSEDIFGLLDGETSNMPAVDSLLQEVMMSRHSFECEELAMYLRASSIRQEHLPTWSPLLIATIELVQQRGEDPKMLCGLLPPVPRPARNTGQPVYKRNQT